MKHRIIPAVLVVLMTPVLSGCLATFWPILSFHNATGSDLTIKEIRYARESPGRFITETINLSLLAEDTEDKQFTIFRSGLNLGDGYTDIDITIIFPGEEKEKYRIKDFSLYYRKSQIHIKGKDDIELEVLYKDRPIEIKHVIYKEVESKWEPLGQ